MIDPFASITLTLFIVGVLMRYAGIAERAERGFGFIMAGAILFLFSDVFGKIWTSTGFPQLARIEAYTPSVLLYLAIVASIFVLIGAVLAIATLIQNY